MTLSTLDDAWGIAFGAIDSARKRMASVPGDDVDRAEAYRQLLRFIGHAGDYYIENADPGRPTFWEFEAPTRKIWGDCPDAVYHLARIDAAHTYRIRGRRGDSHYLGIQVYRSPAAGWEQRVGAVLSGDDLVLGPDGSFEIILGGPPATGNWLPLPAHSNEVIVRQYRLDRAHEVPASFTIEVVEGSGPATLLDPMDLARRLRQFARLVDSGVERTVDLWQRLGAHPNAFADMGAEFTSKFSGTSDNVYQMAAFDLRAGEALEVSFTPPAEAVYWGAQLCNIWFESFEYRDRPVSLNMAQCRREPGGEVRIVVADRDPDHPNWLDTVGHARGMVLVRFMRASSAPLPRARVVRG